MIPIIIAMIQIHGIHHTPFSRRQAWETRVAMSIQTSLEADGVGSNIVGDILQGVRSRIDLVDNIDNLVGPVIIRDTLRMDVKISVQQSANSGGLTGTDDDDMVQVILEEGQLFGR